MNKMCCLIIMLLIFRISNGQMLCIYCYDQNDTISAGVNNLLLNGSFENGCQVGGRFCPNSINYSCNITNWICTGGGDSTYASTVNNIFSIIPDGLKAVYFGNWYCYACSSTLGDISCLHDENCVVAGPPGGFPLNTIDYGGVAGVNLEQTVNGLVTGNSYVLEFWAGGEYSLPSGKQGLFAVDVGFGKTFLRNNPTETLTGIGTRYIIEFAATSSSHTIKFTNWGHICDSCTELIIDDARLYTLAELSTAVPHCSLGINDISASQNMTSVFPNPIHNELNVKTKNSELSETILYDIVSKILLQQKFINSLSLNTEQLARGIYIYEVRNKTGVIKKGKVVKE